MRAERVSWGTWLIMALAIGAMIAWLHDTLGRVVIVQSNAQVPFIAMLNRPPVKGNDGKEYPWVKSVIVYPAMEVVLPYAKGSSRKAQVTYDMLTPAGAKGSWQYLAKSTLVDDPIDIGGKGSQPLTAYLSGLKKDRPWVSHRYAFWSETRWIYGLWVGGSVLLIGIVWPFVLRRLAAAGYAGREEEEKGPSLWQRLFGRKGSAAMGAEYGDPSRAKVDPRSLSAEDLQRIADMEANLGDLKIDRGPGGEVEDEPEPEIKKLDGGPMENKGAPTQKEEPKEYAGEFYPTETHVQKKKEQ